MKKNSTSRNLINVIQRALMVLLTLVSSYSYAQTKIYGSEITKAAHVDNKDNAKGNTPFTYATVNSYGGLLFGAGRYDGELEIKFPNDIPAGKTTFIRIDFDSDVLNKLLQGNLGGLLGDVLGNVLLGDHSFEVGARNSGGTTILKGNSTAAFSSSNLRLIKDGKGDFYVAITPSASYDKVYIKDITKAIALGTNHSMKVYYAYNTTGVDNCAPASFTSSAGTGLTLDLLGVGKAGVTNPEFAIDNITTNYSELSLGALGVAGSISQNFYFETPSNNGDEFKLRMTASAALLTAGVLQNIKVTAYNGVDEVFSQPVSSLLNLDLLGLLQSGNIVSIPFSPGMAFDRVTVTLSSLLNVNLTQTINIYGVTRSAGKPTFVMPATNAISICNNTTASLTATTPSTNELVWYDVVDGGTVLGVIAYNAVFTTPTLTANKTYYVAARRIGCTEESGRVPVVVTVQPAIVFNSTLLSNGTVGFAYTKQIDVATGGTPGFTYTVTSGTLPAGLSVSTAGVISGTPTETGNFNFSVTATDSKLCSNTVAYTLKVTATLVFTPSPLINGVTNTPYLTQTITAATGGTGPYSYEADGLPPGLIFDDATLEIKGTPTQKGDYSVPITVTDANGNKIVANFTIKITDPLSLPSATLVNGITGMPYTPQIIPAATGGTGPYAYDATGLPPGLIFNETTREITGTPTTVGTTTFPVTVTDADLKTVTTNYTIKVVAPLSLPNATLPDGTAGDTYALQTLPQATGGSGGYTYTFKGVPQGLTLDFPSGQLTGAPAQAGNYSITVTVKDSENRTASNVYTIKVIGVLSLPSATLPNGTVGSPYPTQTLPMVVGGTAPYTYVATGLPDGLSFNTTTREITGTPTKGGTYTVSLTATDDKGQTVNSDYTIVVNVNNPTVANTIICSGNTASLSVSNLQNGVTYNWYAATGSAPLATNDTGVYVTGNLTSSTTFYVEAVSGTAVSTRIAVAVTVNSAPSPAVVSTNNQNINAGQTTVLMATADAGNIIKWYGVATGGTALATGNSFTTPELNTTTIFYVETTNANNCSSSTRIPVTVTVITNGTSPACNVANSQNSGINTSLVCLLCGITNPGNAVDADLNNYTRITVGVGLASTGYQQLVFPNAGIATDSIKLNLGLPVGLLDLSVLKNVTVNVMSGSNIVKSYKLDPALLNLVIFGGTRFSTTVIAGASFDRVEIRFGGLASVLGSLDVYGAEIVYPKPTIATNPITICSGNTATINAVANGGTTLNYFGSSTGGSSLGFGSSFTTPTLTTTTIYYVEVSRAGCVNSERIPVTVIVTPVLTVPILAPIADVCAGSSATLAVSNPNPAVTYNWYDASVAGNLIFTGTTYITPVLTATTSYYVEAVQGTCISTSRAEAKVVVNPRPILPAVTASSTSVNAGQTVILNASSTESGVSFKWYTTANATTAVYTGATFVTPPLSATTSYYVEAQSDATGCSSSSRVQITVTVNTGGTPITIACETPISQTNGIVGIALFANVFNPNLAIDNDTQTASSLVMPIGALGVYAFQNVTFSSLSKVGDTVKMIISSPSKLLSLSLLGTLSVRTFNGSTDNNDPLILNGSLINLQLLNGGNQASISFVPTSVFDGVELRLNSGVLGALTSVNLNYVRKGIPAPEISVVPASVCVGQSAVISVANPSVNYTYRWYDALGVYLIGKDGDTFNTGALSGDTKFFVEAVSASGCVSAKKEVNVTTIALPTAPVLVSDAITTCVGSTVVLQVKDPIVGYTYKWYDSNNIDQNANGTTFTIANVIGNTSYSVEAINTCGAVSATKTTATISVGILDAPVISPVVATVSAGSPATLTATSSTTGAIINWYNSPTAVTPLFTGSVFVTGPITASTTYYAEASVLGGCVSARTSVNIILNNDGPNVFAPCGYANTLGNKGFTGLTLLAGVFNENLAVDNLANSGSTLFIPVGVAGGSVYQRLSFSGGLSNLGDTLRIRISSPAKLLSLAVLPSLTVTTFNGSTSNADGITLNNSLIQVSLLSDGSSAILTYVPANKFDGVQLTLNSGLIGALTSVNFNYAQRSVPLPVVASTDVNVCEGSSTTLEVQNPHATLTYKWYLNGSYQANKDGATFTTDASLTPATYLYTVTATANGCETNGTKINVVVLPQPDKPVVASTNPTITCINVPATLTVQSVNGVSFNWYDSLSGGNLLVSNNNSYTTPGNLLAGTYDFYVEAVNGNNCNNTERTKITLVVNPSAIASEIQVGGNTSICATATVTLTATAPLVTTPQFIWYSDVNLTNVLSVGAIYSPTVSTTTTFYVTVSGANRCANTVGNAKEVRITVNPIAVADDITVSGNTSVCAGAAVSLTASSTTVQAPIFSWYTSADLSNKIFEGANLIVSNLTADATYYVTVSGTNKCENTFATAKAIKLTVNPLATASDINVNGSTTVCKNTSATLSATSSTIVNPVFTWYSNLANKTIAYVGATFTTPTLTANTIYYVTVKGDNKCENADADAKSVSITVNEYAGATDITVNNAKICAGGALTLMASSLTVQQPVFTWYNDLSLTSVAYVGPNFAITSLTGDKTYYVTVKGSNKCENGIVDAKVVTVTVNPLATASDVSIAGTLTTCANMAVTLTASSAVINPVFKWYTDATLTNLVFTGAVYTPNLSVAKIYYITVKGDNKCENASGTAKVVTITVNPQPANPIIATAGTSICSGSATSLTVQNAEAGVTYDWYSASTGGNILLSGATVNTPILNASIDYYVQATSMLGCLNPNGRIKVTVTVNAKPLNPTLSASAVSTCLGNVAVLSVVNPQSGVSYNWYNVLNGGTILGTGNSFTTPSVTATASYYVEAVSSSCASAARAMATVTPLAVPIAPASVSIVPSSVCAGSSAVLNVNNPDASLIYRWYATNTGGTPLAEGNTFTTPNLTASSIYYVESIAKNGGCVSTNRTTVSVDILPVLATPVVSVQTTTSSSITFAWNVAPNVAVYEVSVDNGATWQIISSGTSYVVSGLKPGATVGIIVRAKGESACQTSANSTIVTGIADNPLKNDVYIPNAFTPNNDGKNDVFLVYGVTIKSLKMSIYTQWGQLIFQTNIVNNGWDGSYKGVAQPSGVYVYMIEVESNDGTKTMRKGSITLIR